MVLVLPFILNLLYWYACTGSYVYLQDVPTSAVQLDAPKELPAASQSSVASSSLPASLDASVTAPTVESRPLKNDKRSAKKPKPVRPVTSTEDSASSVSGMNSAADDVTQPVQSESEPEPVKKKAKVTKPRKPYTKKVRTVSDSDIQPQRPQFWFDSSTPPYNISPGTDGDELVRQSKVFLDQQLTPESEADETQPASIESIFQECVKLLQEPGVSCSVANGDDQTKLPSLTEQNLLIGFKPNLTVPTEESPKPKPAPGKRKSQVAKDKPAKRKKQAKNSTPAQTGVSAASASTQAPTGSTASSTSTAAAPSANGGSSIPISSAPTTVSSTSHDTLALKTGGQAGTSQAAAPGLANGSSGPSKSTAPVLPNANHSPAIIAHAGQMLNLPPVLPGTDMGMAGLHLSGPFGYLPMQPSALSHHPLLEATDGSLTPYPVGGDVHGPVSSTTAAPLEHSSMVRPPYQDPSSSGQPQPPPPAPSFPDLKDKPEELASVDRFQSFMVKANQIAAEHVSKLELPKCCQVRISRPEGSRFHNLDKKTRKELQRRVSFTKLPSFSPPLQCHA